MSDEAMTFEDEDGESNTLSPEFATATMGHVLLGQGRPEAAREVFRLVLAKDPGDAEAARGLRLLDGPAPAPVTLTAVGHAVDATTVYARWSGAVPGQVLTVVSLWVDRATLRRDERDEALDPDAVDAFVRGLRPGAAHHLAVGRRTPEGFVPALTLGPILTPRAAPSDRVAAELSPVGQRPAPSVFDEALVAWQGTLMPSS